MIIDKIEKKRNKTNVVCGENEYEFSPEIIAEFHLSEGEIDGKTFFEAKKESDRRLAKRRLYALIDRTEKCKKGYIDALTLRGLPYPAVLEAVEEAEKKGWIDDRRYAECYIHLHEKTKGWFRLAAELRAKGVSDEILSSLKEEYADHTDECVRLVEKYMRSTENTFENRQKVYAKLMRKGFSSDEIHTALDKYGSSDDPDE